jgi:hypothetical protein
VACFRHLTFFFFDGDYFSAISSAILTAIYDIVSLPPSYDRVPTASAITSLASGIYIFLLQTTSI